MSNFFNAIGVADMEKVHSAVIGWILSNKCNAFGIKEKSDILCSLFNIFPAVTFTHIDVKVEVYDIDILITTESNGTEESWIIENKIKTNQHSDQLDKYVDIICGSAMTSGNNPKPITKKYAHIPSKYQHYCFLTLIDEKPIGNYANVWHNVKYCDLYRILSSIPSCTGADGVIFKEYVSCLEDLTKSLDVFRNNPNKYQHVFTDGKKPKAEKDETYLLGIEKKYGHTGRIIAENGLETIFQKCYLGELAKNIKYPFVISETHGNAMLNVDVTEHINWGALKSKYPGVTLHAGVELQNGTFTIQIHDMDNKAGNKAPFNIQWKNAFNEFGSSSINPSKNNGRYYVSMSLTQIADWWKGPTYIDFKTVINNCITALQQVVNTHLQIYP